MLLRKVLGPALVVIVVLGTLMLGEPSIAQAQSGPTKAQQAALIRLVLQTVVQTAADDLDVQVGDLQKELMGRTLLDVIKIHGGDPAKIKADAQASLLAAFPAQVSSGQIVQAQADYVAAH
ncbi:MAG TPA: hypothetical protein VMT34_08840, partial [Aggregatilineales bacterium]|nr:hypothetical protein [Aggregatilineales bacterium]